MRRGVGDVPQVRELAFSFLYHSRHFVAEAEIQRQIWSCPPIILQIYTEKSLPQIAWRERAGDSALKLRGLVGEKSLYVVEVPDSIRIGVGKQVQQHSFNGNTEADGMGTLGEERIVIRLNGIPVVVIGRATSNTAGKVTESAHEHLGSCSSCEGRTSYAQVDSGGVRIDRF